MKRKLTGVLIAVALTVMLLVVGVILVIRLVDGVRRIGEMPAEPVVEVMPEGEYASEGDMDWTDGQGGLGYAVGGDEDDAQPTPSPEPMVQVPVIETPEQLADGA